MRMMMNISIPVEGGNAAIRSGKLSSLVQKMMTEVKPEAAYFTADDHGNRSGIFVFDMKESSELPKLAEPWFLGLNAQVTFRPAMTPQDFAAAAPAIEAVLKSV
jgi:hypothetical protein